MTRSVPRKAVSDGVDDALLAPWIATGRVGLQDARLFAAAIAADPSLAGDLVAARAERDAVVAMAGALGRPSARPMLALFAAIDAERPVVPGNVMRLRFDRPNHPAPNRGRVSGPSGRAKISGWR